MFLGITVIGWVLLITIYLPISILILGKVNRAVWIPLAWKIPGVGLAGAILLALPVTDAALSAWKMQKYCPESGLRIYRQVVVEGYFDERLGSSYLKGSGYRFREYVDTSKKVIVRADLTSIGTVIYKEIPTPTARYHFKDWSSTDLGFGIKKSERRIFDSKLSENIAVEVAISRYPGFVDRIWLAWFGPIQGLETCFQKGQKEIVLEAKNILVPIDGR